jgi:hypothetical protein
MEGHADYAARSQHGQPAQYLPSPEPKGEEDMTAQVSRFKAFIWLCMIRRHFCSRFLIMRGIVTP